MFYKSDKQPFCRTCGKPIRKHTVSQLMQPHREDGNRYGNTVYLDQLPQTIAEARKLTNQRVVSVRREKNWVKDADGRMTDNLVDVGINQMNTWDGETYMDEFFCSNSCAEAMGRAAARKGWASKKWEEVAK